MQNNAAALIARVPIAIRFFMGELLMPGFFSKLHSTSMSYRSTKQANAIALPNRSETKS
jgi:hypothetical protein